MTPTTISSTEWQMIAPALALVVAAMVVLVLDVALPERQRRLLPWVTLLGIVVAGGLLIPLRGRTLQGFSGFFVSDDMGVALAAACLIVSGLSVLLSSDFVAIEGGNRGEYWALLLTATCGMLIMVGSADLILLFLGIEVLSISLYVLTGFARSQTGSQEGALKYFLLGSFSIGFMLYGTALVYGTTGSTNLGRIATALANPQVLTNPMLLAGAGLILVGLGFKLALVPFHMWTPDVYQGAPTAVTAYMSVGTKVAAFAGLIRVLTGAFPALEREWTVVLTVIAILTMILGNVGAIAQANIKRMLAYSSIAQAGYVLVPIAAGVGMGTSSIGGIGAATFYLLAYSFMNLGAFAVVAAVDGPGTEPTSLEDFTGLAYRRPLLAAAMALFMFSLAGVPFTAGFLAKLMAFGAAVQAGYVELAIVGVLTSAVAAFYYLRVVVLMYMQGPDRHVLLHQPTLQIAAVIAVAAAGTLWLGIFPGQTVEAAGRVLTQLPLR